MAIVDGDRLQTLDRVSTTYELARQAIASGSPLETVVNEHLSSRSVSYDQVVNERRLHPPLEHPDPAHLLLSGTGLTHLSSATTRDTMHQSSGAEARLTDSATLFQAGVDGGKPADGSLGVQPEWFYKGNGYNLVRPGHPFRVPRFSLDAGEEPEVVGLYVVGADHAPYRVGFALGNELSDHVTEAKNYLYLAHSKLRPCAVGPELLVGELPATVTGQSRIIRNDEVLWSKAFASGEANMSHRISGLEHHHFKYKVFRQPGSVHLHFFGTATLSFGDGVRTQPGDVFEIESPTFGRRLSNQLMIDSDDAPASIAL